MKFAWRLVALILAISVLCSRDAMAAGVNRVGGIGPRAGAMNGAYTAIADDASLFYYNLAGLSQFDESYVEAGTDFVFPVFKLKDRFGREMTSHAAVHALPLLGFAHPVNDRLTLGIGLYTPYGLGTHFKNNFRQLGFDTETLMALTNITPAVAYKLTDRLAVGLGVNIGYGQFRCDTPLCLNSHPTIVRANNEGDGLGVGWGAGVLWQINEKWQCGARYSSATTVNLKGETDIILGPFSFTDSFKADLDFPSSAGLGLAYKPCQKLTLAFGGNWYGYSKNADTLVLKFKKLGIEKGQYMNWKDNTGFHIGAVYELTPAWTLRAGVARGYAAIPDDTVSTLTPDVTGWDVSGGVEFRKNALRIAAHTILGWGRNTVGPSWNQDVYSATVISCGLTGSWQF